MAIEEKNISRVAETVAKFGGKHGSDAEEKKAIESVADAAIEGSMEGKSLYLAFSQTMHDGHLYFVVKSIKLSDAIAGRRRTFGKRRRYSTNSYSSSTNSYSINSISSKLLRGVGYSPPMNFGPLFPNCGLYQSSIVFGGLLNQYNRDWEGENEIWVFEADENLKPNSRIKPFSMHNFNHIKFSPLLVELQGKLYALNGFNITASYMEVFDQTLSKWLSLPDPPIMTGNGDEHFSIVVAGQNILLSNPDVRGVFCFEPEIQNWKAVHSLGAGLPFEGLATAFDDDACGGFLMFKFNYGFGQPDTISVFFMSHQFDSVQTLKSVDLPRLPPEFLKAYHCGLVRVGVGGRKFCLVLNRFFSKQKYTFDGVVYDDFPEHNNKGILLFITFEYEITKSESGSELESKYKILNTNQMEYTPEHTEDESAVTLDYCLHQAFVLNSMEDEDTDA